MKFFPMKYTLLEAANAAAASFSWAANSKEILIAALLSIVPTFEGRYAVTVMLKMGMPAGFAYVLAVVCSSLPMILVLLGMKLAIKWLYAMPWKITTRFADWLSNRSEKKKQKMLAKQDKGIRGKLKGKVSGEMLELIGLYIFVALPLPGTGVWTGSAIAALTGMNRMKSAVAILLGNITACGIMTLAATGVFSFLSWVL